MTDVAAWLPYRLLGSTGRARLEQKVEGVVRRWLDAWAAAGSVVCSVDTHDGDEAPWSTAEPWQAFRVRAGAATAAEVRLYPYRLGAVLGVPLDRWPTVAPQTSATSLAGRLWQALVRGLVNELMDSASIASWELEPAEPSSLARRRAGGPSQAVSLLAGDNTVATLELAPQLINALVPAGAVASGGAMEPRRRAIGTERVTVEAVLGGVEMSLAEFASLTEGDVIVLDARLGGPCHVGVPGVAPVADAVLGKHGMARAVRISRLPATNR